MNPASQCIILLACVAICTSTPILNCRCIKTSKAVNSSLIVDVSVHKPSSYCNKQQVIVTLKDNSFRCLDPNSEFTKQVLQRREMKNAAKMTSSSNTTTVAATSVATSS
ncbi:C-X-C motif chemokine 11-6-like isoform X2 [Melanotaenia boesemani]|uniref:C-X-C motif chemokine 11-6-like isoform X2 n=1 Tax=Melanotaenia boesemani TaxID=1250792 RepID=UPI001C054502|nr:C-X-C motif chemokine 11-6-like isoform X2 [Melanotaenia boesemani]